MVRQRMKEKAKQLYAKDHPQMQTVPDMKELRKAGYMQEAKILVLRDLQAKKRKS